MWFTIRVKQPTWVRVDRLQADLRPDHLRQICKQDIMLIPLFPATYILLPLWGLFILL